MLARAALAEAEAKSCEHHTQEIPNEIVMRDRLALKAELVLSKRDICDARKHDDA